ncbi:glycosyltransferase family 9 protein [Sulfuricella sp.]|uniref:glycosyltransferase family 9 protein n=1 Tax=Sulfuricella sp. TaxID=2099377 RepID=UPI002C84EDFF|nr:glycosyltransferase family 9 protein [Sulfuricella sp.]HUX65226.1 glycosyltransferase family 9 protein [Sulfuricella sp.]
MKILVIRRDNIGDLVCNTPLIHALRQHFPKATICALVNSYNAPVLANNPDIDAVFAYTKAKHRPPGTSIAKVYWDRLRLFAQLRRMHFDYAILAAPRFQPRLLRLAHFAGARRVVGFIEPDTPSTAHIDIGVPYGPIHPPHEVEDVFRLLSPLGITGQPPPTQVHPQANELARAKEALHRAIPLQPPLLIGVHISARKPSQRWPTQNFAALIKRLHKEHNAGFMLFWSPGDTSNPLHPGDDAKAREIIVATKGIPLLAYPTQELGQLIAGLSLCDMVICSDGGAMHLAAGLGKPILCFFGKSDATRWHPWGVPHRIRQPTSQNVSDISVEDAMTDFAHLLGDVLLQAPEL